MSTPEESGGSMVSARMDVIQSNADRAYVAWLDHVTACKAECTTHGVDCATAVPLRAALIEARQQARQ